MDLKGKKLLLMGGSAYSQSLKKYAEEAGFRMIAVGNIEDAPHKRVAHESYLIDTRDVDRLVEIVHEKGIDGIFVGAQETNALYAMDIAKKTNAFFYTDRQTWDKMANKRTFKQLLEKHGIGVTREYRMTKKFAAEDLAAVEYPVIIKPVDGSGAHGISVCQHEGELKKGYLRACENSGSDSAIVEKYITGMVDMFIHYTIVDGEFSVACTFDRNLNFSQGGFTGMAVGYTYPSIYTKQYMDHVNSKMIAALKSAGLKNGAINIQCFTDGERFYFYEAGYRLGGEQMYFFTEQLTGINVFKMIVNQALTGRMSDDPDILQKDDPYFRNPCLSLYVPLTPGIITTLNGVEAVRKIKGVLNVTQMCDIGDTISKDGSLSQVCLRMHIMRESVEALAQTVDQINATLEIRDENGNDMMLEKFDLRKTSYFQQYTQILREHVMEMHA